MSFREALKNELEAGTASFLIRLRCDLEWDKEASQLVSAMPKCCEHQDESAAVERWLAQGFWYLSHFARDWTTHPNFPRPRPEQPPEQAYERLDDLAFWVLLRRKSLFVRQRT